MRLRRTLLVVVLAVASGMAASAVAADPQMAHMVFFTLKEPSDANQQKLMAACKEHLSQHDGTVYFSVGTLAKDLKREVNDQDFHVALHLVFESKAAHDKYQTDPRHLRFIDENSRLWGKVRVFDSYLE